MTALDSIVEQGSDVLIALGGSGIAAYRSTTSDTDVLAIADSLLHGQVRRLASSIPRSDLEIRDLSWLDEIIARLACYSPTINAGPSEFSFWDLRFLARVALGRPVVPNPQIAGKVDCVRHALRIALAGYMSSFYAATYEDVFGLYACGRSAETLLLSGELAQRACLLALLQIELVDPAPKWALQMCLKRSEPDLRAVSGNLLGHLRSFQHASPQAWVHRLLELVNGIVAVGMQCARPVNRPSPVSGAFRPQHCLLGIPEFLVLLDVQDSRILICNPAYIEAVAALAKETQR